MTEDMTEKFVEATLSAIVDGSDEELAAAFDGLAQLPMVDLVTELFVVIEDLTDGVNLAELLEKSAFPLPDQPDAIVTAIRARDMKALERVTSESDLNVVFQAVLALAAALKDARKRL